MYGSLGGPVAEKNRIDQMEWLIGQWVGHAKNSKDQISMSAAWSHDLNEFLEWRVTTTRDSEVIRTLFIMGWDPTLRKIFDFRFDNGGGVRKTLWSAYNDGKLLLGHQTGYQGECQSEDVAEAELHVMSLERIEMLTDSTFLWESTCRVKDGRPNIPAGFPDNANSLRVEFQRS